MIPDTRAIIVYWMMISSFAILVLFWWRPPDPTNQLLNTLIGIYVSTGFITALQWWMGSSKGSEDKNAPLIAAATKNGDTPAPPPTSPKEPTP